MQQYQQIKSLSGMEVAAPIAYLGYVQMPVPHVLFSQQALAPGYYRLDWTLSAFNGQHNIVERKETTYYYVPSNCLRIFTLSRWLARGRGRPGFTGL